MMSLTHYLKQLINPTLALLVAGLLLLLVLAQSLLLMRSPPPLKSSSIAPQQLQPLVKHASTNAAIASLHLFGKSPLPPSALPPTELALSLTGIMAAEKPNSSQALIQTPDGKQALYNIGDTVPGGAIIKQIKAKTVILQRNKQLELLSLPQDPLEFKPLPTLPVN